MSIQKHSEIIYENILHNVRDGVMSVDLDGQVLTYNPAAAAILNLLAEEVMGKNLAQILFSDPRNDDFSDVILKAVYDASTTHKAIVKYYHNEKLKYIQLSTTFLFTNEAEPKKYGIIVVFTDVSQNFVMERMKDLFGKYIDPRIASRLLESDKEQEVVSSSYGQKQVMTVSFCDMQNFTGISDPLSPTELVHLINIFFSKMSKPVHDYHGIIDKYIGDEIMSFWGQPFVEGEDHAILACNAALGQIRSLVSLNKELMGNVPEIMVNIGIATGDLIVGNVGSDQSKNFTVMGSAVSVASRLVSINKLYGTHILITEKTANTVMDDFELRELDTVLAYIQQRVPIRIFELLAKKDKINDAIRRARDNYEQGLVLYRQKRWREARELLVRSLADRPFDKAAIVLMNRIDYYSLHPPDNEWNGVWRNSNMM